MNLGKRLPTNAEWQGAAAGTPTDYEPGSDDDMDDCNTAGLEQGPFFLSLTGSRSSFVSNFGAFDMVGNVFEWVATWIKDNEDMNGEPESTTLYGHDGIFGIDDASPEADSLPAALLRGGAAGTFSQAGVFALNAGLAPSVSGSSIGFRCARNR